MTGGNGLAQSKASGTIRRDVEQRTRELRQRYLAVVLDSLRAQRGTPLPGRPPSWEELSGRWRAQSPQP